MAITSNGLEATMILETENSAAADVVANEQLRMPRVIDHLYRDPWGVFAAVLAGVAVALLLPAIGGLPFVVTAFIGGGISVCLGAIKILIGQARANTRRPLLAIPFYAAAGILLIELLMVLMRVMQI